MPLTLREAEALVPIVKKGPMCSVALIRAGMDDDELRTLDGWLALPKEEMPHTRLGRILRTAGYEIGRDSVVRHRNGECGCPSV